MDIRICLIKRVVTVRHLANDEFKIMGYHQFVDVHDERIVGDRCVVVVRGELFVCGKYRQGEEECID